jgi:hypothetical protein
LNAPSLSASAAQVRLAMEQALSLTFWAMLALSLGTVVLALLIPRTDVVDGRVKSVSPPRSG